MPGPQSIWITLVENLLNWPFLFFALFLTVIWKGGDQLWSLLRERKIEVEVGGNRIAIGEVVQALEEQALDDFGKNQKEIEEIKARLKQLEEDGEVGTQDAGDGSGPVGGIAPVSEDEIFRRMVRALSSSRFRWRSIERLAIEAGVSEQEASQVLASRHGEVVLGKGKSGRRIARLPDA